MTSAAPPAPARARRRVALYSHDTQGLGHVRRNIEVARALLAAEPATDVLLVSGAPEAVNLPRPARAELVVLPTVTKSRSGRYGSTALSLELPELLRLRGALAASAIGAFAPDLLIVDKEARGLAGELDAALAVARDTRGVAGRRTRLVLGLRDVLDAPDAARTDWERSRTSQTLLESYDAVWVYGDRSVHDPAAEYDLPDEVARMVRYTGYLAHGRHRLESDAETRCSPAGPFVLCLVGGGQDGVELARAFVAAPLPAGHRGVVVTGPYMPADARRELEATAARRGDLDVLGFVDHAPELIARSAAVVTMGGYNSVCELLASGRPGLLVPRVTPRREQAVRAEALTARTHLDHLLPHRATPAALGAWTAAAVTSDGGPHDLLLDGLARLPDLADEVLTATTTPAAIPAATEAPDVLV